MSINVFTFSGNLGKDAELRFTPNSKAISEFSVACKSGYGDHEKTSWIRCKMFGKQAEGLTPYLIKGKSVTVTGEFTLEEWEKDGVKHAMPSVAVRDIQLPPKGESAAPQQPENDLDDDLPF